MRFSHSTIVNSILTRLHEDEPAKLERRWVATRYGVELLTSMMILLWGYHMARAQGAVWAIITAILILQPGLDKSMSASGVFIVATLLGASAGTVAALVFRGDAVAILTGCVVAVIVQFTGVQFRRQVSWRRTLTAQITPNEPSR